LELLRGRLARIKALSVGKKGSREAAAAVVYSYMRDQIKLSIKEYCKKNNLSVKLFHQKYKLLPKILQKEDGF
jgi:hypothetical protein